MNETLFSPGITVISCVEEQGVRVSQESLFIFVGIRINT